MTMEEPPKHPPGEGIVSEIDPAASVADSASTIGPPESSKSAANGKVAIPRHRAGVAPRYNRRVPRACESCRQRKTKCSGDTPVCRQCRELRVTCQYPAGWKERTKRFATGPFL